LKQALLILCSLHLPLVDLGEKDLKDGPGQEPLYLGPELHDLFKRIFFVLEVLFLQLELLVQRLYFGYFFVVPVPVVFLWKRTKRRGGWEGRQLLRYPAKAFLKDARNLVRHC